MDSVGCVRAEGDPSKLKNAVAIAQAGGDEEVRYWGEIGTSPAAVRT